MTNLIRKAVIPAAGLGTRLLPVTKEIPKEMLPIPVRNGKNIMLLKPLLQAVFEQLYDFGITDFCFIVGRGKRAIEDHFTPDRSILERISDTPWKEDLEQFYKRLESAYIYFITQPEPRGFGDAVQRAKNFTAEEPFLVQAGDDLIISKNSRHLTRLVKTFGDMDAEAVLLVERNPHPQRYGVVEGKMVRPRLYKVSKIVEKPFKPPTNLTTIAVYVFKPSIYNALSQTAPDEKQEIQLTDAIQRLLHMGKSVYALELPPTEKRIDIGTHESFLEAYAQLTKRYSCTRYPDTSCA